MSPLRRPFHSADPQAHLAQSKRTGSDSEMRFDQYRTGMTIPEYIQPCEGLNVPNYALSDINWDLERRFISLYD
ncbi:MAG: hypothetical protein ACJ72H_18230 [Candidatus Sulfotelmatobacter sp.]